MADPVQRNKNEARGGINVAAIKWVLGVSLVLAIIAMLWTYLGTPEAAPGAGPVAASAAGPAS